jgi:hypothetical protein
LGAFWRLLAPTILFVPCFWLPLCPNLCRKDNNEADNIRNARKACQDFYNWSWKKAEDHVRAYFAMGLPLETIPIVAETNPNAEFESQELPLMDVACKSKMLLV